MNEISARELLDKYKRDDDLNVLAFVVTPWVAHGVDAFIEYLIERGLDPKGAVIIIAHGQAGILVNQEHFSTTCKGISFYRLKEESSSIKDKIRNKLNTYIQNLIVRSKNGRELFVLNQGCVNFEWHAKLKHLNGERHIQSVILDEGIGMYMRDKKAWAMESISNTTSFKQKVSIIFSLYILNPCMERHLKKINECTEFCLLKKSANYEFIPDKETIKYYGRVIKKIGAVSDYQDSKKYENAVVINTQPFYEYNQVYHDEDIRAIKMICDLCSDRGISVVLKPHPREKNIERYDALKNCLVDRRKGITQESIISQLQIKPKLIVGFSSTTLVSEKIFEQIPAMSLVACIDTNNVESKMAMDFCRFQKTFKNIVAFPRNVEEVGLQLDSIEVGVTDE